MSTPADNQVGGQIGLQNIGVAQQVKYRIGNAVGVAQIEPVSGKYALLRI